MSSTRVLRAGVSVGLLLGLVWAAVPPRAHAGFNVGAQLRTITPNGTLTLPGGAVVNPLCDPGKQQSGTSLAIVQGSKLAGVDPAQYPVVLAVTCLDINDVAKRNQLSFLDPATGTLIKTIQTTAVPSNGWAHLVHRPDKGDLLGCSNDGAVYSIVYSQFDTSRKLKDPVTGPTLTKKTLTTALPAGTYNVRYTYITAEGGETLASNRTQLITTSSGSLQVVAGTTLPAGASGIAVYVSVGTATETKQGTSTTTTYNQTVALVSGAALPLGNTTGLPGTKTQVGPLAPTPLSSCAGLAWDPEEDMIYQGVTNGTGVHRFKDGTTTDLGAFNTTCTPAGLAINGGVLNVACSGVSTILRLNKTSGSILSPNGTLGVLGQPAGANLSPSLGDLACDPVSFQPDPLRPGKDQFKDGMWSRNGSNGNGVVALEFPAFTCGLPSWATVLTPGLASEACFETLSLGGQTVSRVKDLDGDGLPDCWEDGSLWDGKPGIDFDGDGVRDLILCVNVDTNGSGGGTNGTLLTEECAHTNRKDIFVQVGYMAGFKPNPLALSQPDVATAGVTSVKEAFNKAPVDPLGTNPQTYKGIDIHFQVEWKSGTNDVPVTFTTLGNTTASVADQLVFTPCTGPASFAKLPLTGAADFDVIKKANFGTTAERALAQPQKDKTLGAKRLAFHYMLFAKNQVGTSPGSGSSSSGCSEVGGDDTAITLGSFAQTKEQQAATVMHELGHNLGLRHGGHDNVNCKPNYLSVMSYLRQFPGSPINNRRLDYSRAELPDLNELSLDQVNPLGTDASLGPLASFLDPVTHLPTPDQTAFGPSAWTVVQANGPINWGTSADINQGPVVGCDGAGGGLAPAGVSTGTPLEGHNDWANLLYRFGATLDAAGGVHSATSAKAPDGSTEHVPMTSDDEQAFFDAADLDPPSAAHPSGRGDGFKDALACGLLTTPQLEDARCIIDIKPNEGVVGSFVDPNVVNLGKEANISAAILSNPNFCAPCQVIAETLTLNGVRVKRNTPDNGLAACNARDVNKDGLPDLVCQFPTAGLAKGLIYGVVEGLAHGYALDSEVHAIRGRDTLLVQ